MPKQASEWKMEMKDLYIRNLSLIEPIPRESYLSALPVVHHLSEHGITFHKQVTFFVGENGSGKSTLIEALAISQGFNPEGGTKNFSFATEDSHSELCNYLRVAKGVIRPKDGFFLRAESFYNVASNIDQMDRESGPGAPVINSYGGISLHKQSHGESFLSLVENRFGGHGLYIVENGIVRFQITEPGQYTVVFNDSVNQAVHIFANPLETDVPDKDDPDVFYIGPGEWVIDSISLKDGQTLYLSGGAVLHSIISVSH